MGGRRWFFAGPVSNLRLLPSPCWHDAMSLSEDMLIKIVIIFLAMMMGLAFISGPAFRRVVRNLLGLDRDDR